MENVVVPRDVVEISLEAFRNCYKLRTVTIKTEVLREIPAGCFKGSGLEEIEIPKSIMTIRLGAF